MYHADKFNANIIIKMCFIYRDYPVYVILYVDSKNPSPCAKAAFVICFTLAFESTSFGRKAMKYFVSAF